MNFYQRMGILPLKKRVNRDKCSFTTKQRMFGVFAIDEILRYRGSRIPGSPTLCHPALNWAGVVQHSMGWTEQTDIMWTKGGRVSTGTLALTDIFTLSALLSIGAHYVSHKGHKYRIKSTPSRPDTQPGPQNILPKIVRLEFVSHEGGGGRKFVAMFELICCTMRSVPVSSPPLFITITTLYWSAEF